MPNEADTCRRYVVPKLQAAGWDDEPHRLNEQVTFTDGRIVVVGRRGRRRPGKRADYLLRYRPDLPIAVVEAKPSYATPAAGLQQAKDYAEVLGLKYYELPLPEGRKNYSKTKPIQFEEFADCIDWFTAKRRKENDRAWRVPAADVLKYDANSALLSCNLDIKNPNSAESLEHLPPQKLVEDILDKERRIIRIMEEIKAELAGPGA